MSPSSRNYARLVSILLILATPCYADPPDTHFATASGDAPLADVPRESVSLRLGDPAPFAGRLLSDAEQVRRGKRLADAEGELAKARESQLLPTAAVIALIAGAVASGVAIGVGTTLALQRR